MCFAAKVLDGVVAAAVDDAGSEDETLLTEQRALEPQNASELQLGLLQVRRPCAGVVEERTKASTASSRWNHTLADVFIGGCPRLP